MVIILYQMSFQHVKEFIQNVKEAVKTLREDLDKEEEMNADDDTVSANTKNFKFDLKINISYSILL
jgi:hypothetical protein